MPFGSLIANGTIEDADKGLLFLFFAYFFAFLHFLAVESRPKERACRNGCPEPLLDRCLGETLGNPEIEIPTGRYRC